LKVPLHVPVDAKVLAAIKPTPAITAEVIIIDLFIYK
jgi:hypothetical protein